MAEGFTTPDAHHDAYLATFGASAAPATATAEAPEPIPSDAGSLLAPVQDPTAVASSAPPTEASAPPLAGVYAQHDAPTAAPDIAPGALQPGGFLGQTDAELAAQKQKDIQGRMDQATGGDEAFTTPDDQHAKFLKQEEDAGVFHTPDEGNQAFIEQMANSRDDPLDLYAQDAITDLDTAAKIYKKKAEDFSKKDLGQKLKDEAYDLPDDVRRLAGAFAGGVASLPGMIVGGVQAGNQLWQLMPFSGSSADEKARAMRGLVAGGESIGQSASGMLNTVQQGIANTPILGSLMSDLTGKPMSAEEQKTLMDAGTPVSRPLDPKTATLDEVKQEALARKALADSAQKIQAGDVGPGGEAVLKFLAYDQTAPTVAQLEARGVPWQPMAVQGYNDIANTLALAVAPEVPVVGEASRFLSAKGLQYGGKAATALGFGGEKAADLGFKLGKWGLKLGSLGMLAIDHDDLLNPFALARLIKAAWMHPEAAAWVGGIAGAAKAVPWGLQYMGNIWTKAGADRLAGSSLLGQENILSQVIGRTSQSAAQGAAANVLYSLPFTQDPEQLAQSAGQGAGIGSLLGMPGNVTQSGRSVAFDQPFTKPGMTPKDAPPPAPIDYGTDLTLDRASAQAIKGIPNELQTRVNGVKNMMNGKAEIYVLPDAEYDKKQAQGAGINGLSQGQIKSAGVMMTTGPNGTPQVFLRQGKVGEALYHETGHALWQYLPTDSQNAFTQAALAKGNPDAFLQRYTKDPTATASSLPTEADVRNGAPRGPGGFTQELLREEIGAEGFGRVLNGQTVDQLSKDPGVVRNMQFGLGRLLERLGVPTTTAESQSILGFQPHLTDGLVLDQFIRRQLAGATQNVRTPVTPAGQPAAATPASAPVPTGSPPAPVGVAPVAPAPSPGTIPGPQPAGAASGPPPPATAPPATAAVSPAATAPLPVAPVVPSVTPAALATARAEAIRGLKGLGFSLADAKTKVAASSGTTTQEILQDVLAQRGRGNIAPPPPAPPPTPSKLTAMPGAVPATPPVAAAPPPVNPAEQAYQDSLAAVVKNAAARAQESGTTTAVQTAPGPVVAPGVPETGTKEPATPATPVKVATDDVQKAWNQQHPNFPSTDVTVDEQGNYHVRHAGGDEDILSPNQLADLGLKGSGAPVKGNTLAGATSARQIDPTTAEARTTWFGLNPNGSNDLGDVDAHGRNLKGYFGDETHNPDVVGASLPWRTLAGTVGDFTRDPKLMEAIRKGDYKVRITAADGKTVDAKIVDVGPAEWTRAGLDITYGTGKALGLTDTTTTRFQVIGPDGKPLELRSAPRDWVPKGGQGAPGRSTGPSVEGETLPVRERHRQIEEAPGLEEPPAARRAPTGEASPETGQQKPTGKPEEGSAAALEQGKPEAAAPNRVLEEQKRLYAQENDLDLGHAAASGDRVAQGVLEDRYGKTWLSQSDPSVQQAFQSQRPEDYALHQRRVAIGLQADETARRMEQGGSEAGAQGNQLDVLQQIQTHGGLPSVARLKGLEGQGETMGGEVRRVYDAWKALSPDAKRALNSDYGITSSKLFSNEARPLDLMRNDLAQTSDHVFDRSDDLLSHVETLLSNYAAKAAKKPKATPAVAATAPSRPDNAMPVRETAPPAHRDVKPPPGLSSEDVQKLYDTGSASVKTSTARGQPRSGDALAKEQEKAGNQAVLAAHAAQLEPGDERVRLGVDPDTGRRFVSGTHFVADDPVHSHLLSGVPKEAIGHADQWSKAIDQGKAVTLTYRSPKASERSHVGEVRAKEYAADPAEGRATGKSEGTPATKQMLPLAVQIAGVNEPGPKAVILHALSPDKLTQNFAHIRESLDASHPAKAMSDEQFAQEVGKYIQNHAHGYRGDGTAALAGTEGVPVKVDPSYEPQLLGERVGGSPRDERQRVADARAVGEVINGAFNSETAQSKGPKAERAIGLSEANQGYVGEGGETNPLRERLNKLWTEKKLVSPFEDIRADNVIKFHGPSDKGPAAIRAQSSPVTKALETHGLPNRQYVSAGFMPIMGERATGFEKADREGRTFVNPADNRKRFEVSDKGMTFKSGFKEAAKQGVRLADAIDHPELFKNYPFLKDVTVKVDPSLSMIAAGNYEAGHLHDTGHGFAFTPGQINLSGNAIGKANAALEGGYKKTLVHEIQHAIQDHEGLSGGSNPQVNKNPLKGLVEYWNNPGEKEARKAEGRANLSQKQLDENPPYKRSSTREGNAPAPTLDSKEVQAVYDRLKSRNASGKVSPWDMARELGVDGQALIQYFKSNPMQGRSQKYVRAGFMPMMGERATGFPEAEREGRVFLNPYDQKKRFEVSDAGMHWKETDNPGLKGWNVPAIKEAKGPMRLEDVIDHTKLFQNYPQLKDLQVRYEPNLKGGRAYYDPGQMGDDPTIVLSRTNKMDLVHEIQHAIQEEENFRSKGSSPAQARSQLDAPELKRIAETAFEKDNPSLSHERLLEKLRKSNPGAADEDLVPNMGVYYRNRVAAKNNFVDAYVRLHSGQAYTRNAGEIEAREAGSRHLLTDEERSNNPPFNPNAVNYIPPDRAWFMPMMGEVPRTTSEESGTRAMFMPQVSGRQASEKVPKDIKGTPEAFPVKFHTSRTGSIVAQTIPYDLANSPISGKAYLKEVPNNAPKLSESDQKQFHYLSPDNQDRLANLDKKGVVSKLGDKVVNQVKQWESVPDVMAGKGWYSRLREKIQTHLGPNADLFSQLLGATSASNGAQQNFLDALQAYQLHQNGTYDRHVGLYQRGYQMMKEGTLNQHLADSGITEGLGMNPPETDAQALAQYISHHDITPLKENGKLYGQNSAAVLKVLAGTWLEQAEGPKTPNYSGNFSGRTLEATIDKWVARNLRRLSYEDQKRWRIQPQSESGVSDLDFAFGQKVMRNASEKLGMNPDDLQAIVWMGEKHEWEQRKWSDPGAAQDKVSYDEPFRLAFEGERPLTHEETRQALIAQKPPKEKKAPKASFMPVVSPMPHTVHIHFHGLPMPGVRRDNRDLIR